MQTAGAAGDIHNDPTVGPAPKAEEASAIVCFDAYVTNVDRTPKNPNMLSWHKALWLIDSGYTLVSFVVAGAILAVWR